MARKKLNTLRSPPQYLVTHNAYLLSSENICFPFAHSFDAAHFQTRKIMVYRCKKNRIFLDKFFMNHIALTLSVLIFYGLESL